MVEKKPDAKKDPDLASEILAKIEESKDVEYPNVTIRGDLDLSGLDLPKDDDGRCIVDIPIKITNSKILGNVKFGNAVFQKLINFKGTDFSNANFTNDKFEAGAGFKDVEFGSDAYFRKVTFKGDSDFEGAHFGGDAHFGEAQFEGSAKYNWATFSGDAHFPKAQFHKTLDLNKIKFNKLYISWDAIKDKLRYYDSNITDVHNNDRIDGTAYLALIKNFKAIEQFDDADDCYYQYRKASQAKKKWFDKKRFNWSKLLDWIGFASCGYGVKVWRPIVCAFGSVLGFTLLYKLLPQSRGGIAESGPSTVTMEAVNNSTLLFTFSSGDGAVSPSWGECLYFSFTALTGGTPDGLHPVRLCKYAVMVEGVLGYLFLALFVVVLARKIIR